MVLYGRILVVNIGGKDSGRDALAISNVHTAVSPPPHMTVSGVRTGAKPEQNIRRRILVLTVLCLSSLSSHLAVTRQPTGEARMHLPHQTELPAGPHVKLSHVSNTDEKSHGQRVRPFGQ
eukprot:1329717-Prymnesium_polylepis.1